MKNNKGYGLGLLLLLVMLPLWAQARSCPTALHELRAVPVAQAADITIATQNLEKFFDDVKNGPAKVLSAEEFGIKLEKLSLQLAYGLRQPDVLAVQEVENQEILKKLAEAVAAKGEKPAYQVLHHTGPDSGGHHSGFMVRSDWKILKKQALLASEKLGQARLFDRPPLLIRVQTHTGKTFDVVNVHLKSLMGSTDPKKWQKVAQKRQRQADMLAAWLKERLAQKGEPPLVVLGDFNALPAGTDNLPGGVDVMATLQSSGMNNAIKQLPVKEQFSYVFRCEPEALDHALLSSGWQLRSLAFSRGNAEGHRRYEQEAKTPLRSSDHDGLVLYLQVQ